MCYFLLVETRIIEIPQQHCKCRSPALVHASPKSEVIAFIRHPHKYLERVGVIETPSSDWWSRWKLNPSQDFCQKSSPALVHAAPVASDYRESSGILNIINFFNNSSLYPTNTYIII